MTRSRASASPQACPSSAGCFSQDWAARNRAALAAFLDASQRARALLATSNAEWDRIAKLTGAASPAELERLKILYRRGIPARWGAPEQAGAARLYDILASLGGPALVGTAAHLSPGTFWQPGGAAPG